MKYCEQCQSAYPNDFQVCPRDNAPLRATSDLAEGMIIANKYAILERIGMGGMATVYRARHLAFNEIRAIKILKSRLADDASVKRFRTEAIIARKLEHPNAVRVDDLDITADGQPFIVMEYVSGRSLRRVIREQGPLPAARALKIALQVADALRAAHELGIVHRDIKPDNVLLTDRAGLQDFVKVLDFGIAKVREGPIDQAADYTTTQAGMVVGTPAYLSPEQARGNAVGQVDGRADLYSLGVVIYEMITGELPFKAEASMDMILHHLHTPATPPHELRPELRISRGLSMLLMKALEKDRNYRFQSAEEMLLALQDPDGALASGKFRSQEAQYYEEIGDDTPEMQLTGLRGSENYEAAAAAPALAQFVKPAPVHAMEQTVRMAEPIGVPSRPQAPVPSLPKKFSSMVLTVPLIALVTWGIAYLYFRPDVRAHIAVRAKHAYATVAVRLHRNPPRPSMTGSTIVPRPSAALAVGSAPQLAPATPAPGASTASAGPPNAANGVPTSAVAAASAMAKGAPGKGELNRAATPAVAAPSAKAASIASPASAHFGELVGHVLIPRSDDAEITVELEKTGLNFDQSLSVEADGGYRFSDVPVGRGYTISAFENGEQKDKAVLTIHPGVNRAALLRIPEPVPDENVRVYGKVFDEQNEPVAGVQIKLQSAKLSVDIGAITGPKGDFSFSEVPPSDDYKLSVIKNNVVFSTQAENVAPRDVNPEHIVILYLAGRK